MTSGERIERMEEIANWIDALCGEWCVGRDEAAPPAALMAQARDLGPEFDWLNAPLTAGYRDFESGEDEPRFNAGNGPA